MGVHDLGFRGYRGERTSVLERIRAILGSDVRRNFKSWKFLIYYLFSIAPAVMQLVVVYIWFVVFEAGEVFRQSGGFGRGRGRGQNFVENFFGASLTDVAFYFTGPLVFGLFLTIIYSGVVGASMIARDRKSNALEIYFTRGIRPLHYFCGKWGATVTMLLAQVLVPYLIVWLWAWALAPDGAFFTATWPMLPRLVLAQLCFCGLLGWFAVALSASSESPPFAVIRWTALLFGLLLVGRLFVNVLDDDRWLLISPWNVLTRVAGAIAGVPGSEELPLASCLIVLAVLFVLSLLWLRRFLRPVEVVG